MIEKDQAYYQRRVAEETAAAQIASCAYARDVHLDLAARYSAKLQLIEAAFASLSDPQLEIARVYRTASG